MSGGHFNDNGYAYYDVDQFADELEQEIAKCEDRYSPKVMDYLKKQVPVLRYVSTIMKHIDYLFSADHGDDTFADIIESIMCKAEVLPAPTVPTVEMLEAAYDVDVIGVHPFTMQRFKMALDDEEVFAIYLTMIDRYNGITGKCLLSKTLKEEIV